MSTPYSLDSDDEEAVGDSDQNRSASTPQTAYHERPTPGQKLPRLPQLPALPSHNPFTGSPIRALSQLGPQTSFVRSSQLPGASELPQERDRFHDALGLQGDPIRQMLPPRMAYPSAHSPSIQVPCSHAPSVPHTRFNLNQYNNFGHANPYQLPYVSMIGGLDIANLGGLPSSPLRQGFGGQLTLSPFMPVPEEVTPSPYKGSIYAHPSPRPTAPLSQGSSAVISSDYSTSHTSISYGAFNPSPFSQASMLPDYSLHGTSHSPSGLLGVDPRSIGPYASFPYMPPFRMPSSGPPPPLGLFKVSEKPKTPWATPKPIDSNLVKASIPLRHLVIRLGQRVVVSHHFTASCRLTAKVGEAATTIAKTSLPMKPDSGIYAPMHRTAETGILGVQGPKANLFVFDNPEELLRKQKSQKSAQPISPKGTNTGSSSPLSELSLSPQLPATIPAPVTRKRKRLSEQTTKRNSGPYVKKARSPDRLTANTNPPLNEDCVIQFAVSERQGGALRQVKSERRGIFKEDTVVMGCRFFVRGC